jgi:hypothetical protein
VLLTKLPVGLIAWSRPKAAAPDESGDLLAPFATPSADLWPARIAALDHAVLVAGLDLVVARVVGQLARRIVP